MEFDIPEKGQTPLMERIFRQCDLVEGIIGREQVPSMLQRLHPEMNLDDEELEKLIAQHDTNGSGQFDFDTVTKIIFNLLMKQSTETIFPEESLITGNRTNIKLSVEDFIIFNNL